VSILGGKQAVKMGGEVRGTTKVDPGPISRGPNAFWAELQIDSFCRATDQPKKSGQNPNSGHMAKMISCFSI
jgi:hypothetical protein